VALQSVQRLAVFDSLRNRDFRWFWLARLATSASMEMGSVAQGWLVYQLTGSALALGWVSSARSIARLGLSLYGGALADRLRRRQVLIWARAAMFAKVLAIAILIYTGAVQVWHLVAYSFLSGVISALMMPAQKAYLAQLVGRKALLNAVSLTFASMALIGIFGASTAGFVIEWAGAEVVYFVIAALYACAVLVLGRLPPGDVIERRTTSVWRDLRQGVRYLKVRPVILPLLAIVVVRVILGWSYRTLMPVYASEVLQIGARGLGFLAAAPSIGSLFGSLTLASLGDFRGKGKLLLIGGCVMGLSLVAFSRARHFALAFLCLLVVGAARRGLTITNQTLIQVNCEDAYRGRIMAMYMMAIGLMPLGTLPAGAMADAWGVPLTLTLQGGLDGCDLCCAVVLTIQGTLPRVRRAGR
jgi:MFS family permease